MADEPLTWDRSELVECVWCRGTGQVVVTSMYDKDAKRWRHERSQCPDCGGRGHRPPAATRLVPNK